MSQNFKTIRGNNQSDLEKFKNAILTEMVKAFGTFQEICSLTKPELLKKFNDESGNEATTWAKENKLDKDKRALIKWSASEILSLSILKTFQKLVNNIT